MKLKAIAIALGMVAASQANATLIIGGLPEVTTGLNNLNSSEFTLSVYNAITGDSYTRDLGFQSAGTNFNTASMSFAADSLLTSFMGSNNTADLVWGVIGYDNYATGTLGQPLTYGNKVWSTFSNSMGNMTNGGVIQASSASQLFYTSLNLLEQQQAATNASSVTNGGTATFSNISKNFVNLATWSPTAMIGGSLMFGLVEQIYTCQTVNGVSFCSAPSSTALALQTIFTGDWSLAANGTLQYSTVPVPAALWLMGSGLVGLLGIGRRKA